MSEFIAERKIADVVAAYAVYAKRDFNIIVDQEAEKQRLYADYQDGYYTIQDMEEDLWIYQHIKPEAHYDL